MQSPNHRYRDCEYDKVHDHVESLIHNDESGRAEAVSLDIYVPVGAKRAALQCTGHEDTRRPCGNEDIQAEGEAKEAFSSEEAAVEANEGDLDHRGQDEIDAIESIRKLTQNQLNQHPQHQYDSHEAETIINSETSAPLDSGNKS
ncbi:mitochondrial translation initiation factor [Aspergillus luchuensis]|uniref:Mitochondrial translation initiation factor n=1 Tax=Aspergillus kawachii TaxID=1069201 RepID=A0A146FPG4_ASPKA|nr:mitochondrial translation initiation factor [Aspergillus luchuensis]